MLRRSLSRVSEPSQQPRRVVVAEDEALIRLDLVEMLAEEGYLVVGQAGDGRTAVELAARHRPDVVIMDVKMPVLDGISAAEQITAERLSAVVMLTAFSQRELVERAVEAGAMAYVVKPFAKADLAPAIEVALARHQQLAAVEAEAAGLADALETRKVVERAKSLLQARHGLSEAEAFRWIQKASMDRRLTMRQVAEAVVAEAAAGDPKVTKWQRSADAPAPPDALGPALG
jgi:response regulator NasT